MGDPADRITTADREAADWFARLGSRSISGEALASFEAWRRNADNLAAYNRIERVWQAGGRISGDPEMQKAAQDALARTARSSTNWNPAAIVGGLALACAAIVAVGLSQMSSRTTYSTAIGEQRPVTLADGTTVRLDTNSAIQVRYSGDQRIVVLENGQAFFDVTPDADRPFIVESGGTSVTALGTTFDVRRYGTSVEVTLVSGSVEVEAEDPVQAKRWRLEPGSQLRVAAKHSQVLAVDTAAETSWTQGELIFRDQPLGEALAEVNRYLVRPVRLDAGRLGDVRVSGVFKTGDRDAFVSAATDLFELQAVPEADGSIRLVRTPTK